jgi:hypothetical protein
MRGAIMAFVIMLWWQQPLFAAVPPPDPDPLTFTKFMQLMKIEYKIEPGAHKIYLTWRQKETAKKIYFPMFSPNVLCGMFDDLAGKTVIVAAVGETDVEYTCERTN